MSTHLAVVNMEHPCPFAVVYCLHDSLLKFLPLDQSPIPLQHKQPGATTDPLLQGCIQWPSPLQTQHVNQCHICALQPHSLIDLIANMECERYVLYFWKRQCQFNPITAQYAFSKICNRLLWIQKLHLSIYSYIIICYGSIMLHKHCHWIYKVM